MFLDIVRQDKRKGTITRIETFNLLDQREIDMYNELLKGGIKILKTIHKTIPGIPGNAEDDPIEPQLIEIVKYQIEV